MLGDFPSSMLGTVAIMSCKLETLAIMSQGMWKSYINWILKNKKINNAGKREKNKQSQTCQKGFKLKSELNHIEKLWLLSYIFRINIYAYSLMRNIILNFNLIQKQWAGIGFSILSRLSIWRLNTNFSDLSTTNIYLMLIFLTIICWLISTLRSHSYPSTLALYGFLESILHLKVECLN